MIPAEAVRYAHIAVLNLHDGRIAVGARISYRSHTDDGRVLYEPVAVASLLIDASSTRAAIPLIIAELAKAAGRDTKLLIVRANVPQFQKWREIERGCASVLSCGIALKVSYKPGIERSIPELMALANDALERGGSVICAI